MKHPVPLATLALFCLAAAAGGRISAAAERKAPPTAPRAVDFARDVRPLLAARCTACHGASQAKGGLRLDLRDAALRGGDSGPAIVPGRAARSLLVRYVSGAEKTVMPPAGPRLTAAQVALLRAWIDRGARWPETAAAPAPAAAGPGAGHWSFQPVRPPRLPVVKRRDWVRNDVDAFVLARLEREGFRPSSPAAPATLIRRLYLDLLGIPPLPDEVEAFARDRSPGAYERLVDRLLSSPHYGERWGRHWLDLARYADSDGYEKDSPRPFAWVYRDWVIRALNADMSFDRFTVEQLAGDLLPGAGTDQKIATGFHRNTLTNKEGGVDQEEFRTKAVVDRVHTTGAVWLGLTVGCAECHSHKYDPISQREFYGLYAFFNSADEVDLPLPQPQEESAYRAAHSTWEAEHDRLKAAMAKYERDSLPGRLPELEQSARTGGPPPEVAAVLALPAEQRTEAHQAALLKHLRTLDPALQRLDTRLARHARAEPPAPVLKAQTLSELPAPRATHVHVRGDFLRKGEPVSPTTLAVLPALPPASAAPTRLDLARWLVDPGNPLTPRVTVNRVWQNLFGRGLVNTPDDFGTRGDRPTHPELLDYLAHGFARTGFRSGPAWSLKGLIRLLVTSATYRQASAVTPELLARDPRNTLLARQTRFRPEAEIVRDLFLGASGLLSPKVGGPSIRPPLPADIAALGYAGSVKWTESTGEDRYRRGMYIFFQRTVPYPMLMTFDAPDGNTTCTRRERSNTPLQALALLNDPVFFECAQALGARTAARPGGADDRIRFAFRACVARDPSAGELAKLRALHADLLRMCRERPEEAARTAGDRLLSGVTPAEGAAWVGVARTILNLDEFVTRE